MWWTEHSPHSPQVDNSELKLSVGGSVFGFYLSDLIGNELFSPSRASFAATVIPERSLPILVLTQSLSFYFLSPEEGREGVEQLWWHLDPVPSLTPGEHRGTSAVYFCENFCCILTCPQSRHNSQPCSILTSLFLQDSGQNNQVQGCWSYWKSSFRSKLSCN